MEQYIDLQRIEMEKKPVEILIKIDKVALLINNEAMDIPEVMYIRDIQIKQVYLNLIKEYLDAVDFLEPDIEARKYRNMFLVFDCFDLRKEVDERYRKHQIPFIQMTDNTNDCTLTHSEVEETFEDIHPEYVSSKPNFKPHTMGRCFINPTMVKAHTDAEWAKHKLEEAKNSTEDFIIQSEYEKTIPDNVKVVTFGDEQRSFAFTGTTCCSEVTTEEQIKKVKETKVCKKAKTKPDKTRKNNIELGGLWLFT